MAAVLRYSHEPAQTTSMQFFFRPLSTNRDHSNGHHIATPCHGLDGTADQSEPVPTLASHVDNNNPSSNSADALTSRLIKSSQNVGQIHADQEQEDADTDPNSSRRKRRKITPKKNQQTLGDQFHKLNNKNGRPKTPNKQDILHNDAETTNSRLSNLPHGLDNGSPNLISAKNTEQRTPKNRTPRKQRLMVNDNLARGVSSTDVSIEDDNVQPISYTQKRRSPRNQAGKTMSLHTNGKLVSSPTQEPLPSDKTSPKVDARPVTTRNFKVKSGKICPSLQVRIRYGQNETSREKVGNKIDNILSKPATQPYSQNDGSKTHPFFLSKSKATLSANEKESTNENHHENDRDSIAQRKDPIAWKDIKFTSKKPFASKSSESLVPPWPPLQVQHIGFTYVSQMQDLEAYSILDRAKQKARLLQFSEEEDLLRQFITGVRNMSALPDRVRQPNKKLSTGREVADITKAVCVEQEDRHQAITAVRSRIASGCTPFDRGECPGPNLWPQHYAPMCWSEVLQPATSVLHSWLQSLAVHNVKSGVDNAGKRQRAKPQIKKKRRKPKDEFDDFIVGSDEDNLEIGKSAKTAILIVGPNGCGKTASVFAVAKELDFEVFEIHPGMRRSAKDIFDKVGDMAHNHLVQKGNDLSRSSSIAPSEPGVGVEPEIDTNQTSVANFFGSKAISKPPTKEDPVTVRAKREQKQSLILFEEVDLLFDEDRGFWSGVQSLIAHSRRPVVLTCNDISSVPVDELDLHDVLTYTSVSSDIAADYLTHIAASEGHILDRTALSTLYASKGEDLRASITELNFWCQMTVGSHFGGLDWMGRNHTGGKNLSQSERIRTFSQGTFYEALDLLPQPLTDEVAAIKFVHEELGLPALELHDFSGASEADKTTHHVKDIALLESFSRIAEAQSAADTFSDEALYSMAGALASINCSRSNTVDRHTVSRRYIQQHKNNLAPKIPVSAALEAIMIEKPTFPPSQGRLAPSLDSRFSHSIATDVAPYVRAIVSFDQHIERHRDEIFGSQGKQRTTRAARAAAEGGDKSKTRTERWFPKNLDFSEVMRTASNWPQWYGGVEHGMARNADMEVDARTPDDSLDLNVDQQLP